MTDKQKTLAQQWGAVFESAGAAIEWVGNVRGNAKRLNSEADSLIHRLCQARNKARSLGRVVERPMTIGFFGLSQAGKSYLISALAAGQNGHLQTQYGSERIDFVDHFNPPGGGKEATGLVTRFTRLAGQVQDPDFPVEVRLFREIELAKILTNAWFKDFDQGADGLYRVDTDKIEKILARFTGRENGPIQPGVDADDVVSLWDYANDSFKGYVAPLQNSGYWWRAMQLAPRLKADERAVLFSVLWGEQAEMTDAYAQIAGSLAQLGGAEVAFAPLGAFCKKDRDDKLEYRSDSIISVDILRRLGTNEDLTVAVRPLLEDKLGGTVGVKISHLAALITELVFPLIDEPRAAGVKTVDLLDFPGYRGRLGVTSFGQIPDTGSQVAQLILRGKVAYLFERYTESQEMNGLVICTASDKQSDVSDVHPVLEQWVYRTQGKTPEERAARQCGLIWAITRFDMRIQSMIAHGESMMAEGWNGMMTATIEEKFSGLECMQNWAKGAPFNNAYLVRNPAIRNTFIASEDGKETALDAGQHAAFGSLKKTFVASGAVQNRFADASAAWDAMLALNDGGMASLADYISSIATLDFKLKRSNEQLVEECHAIVDSRLAKWHQNLDGDDLEKKKQVAAKLAGSLFRLPRQSLIELLSRLELSSEDLRDLYLSGAYMVAHAAVPEEEQVDATPQALNPFGALAGADEANPFDAPFDDVPASAPPAKAAPVARKTPDHYYADAVFRQWVGMLSDFPDRATLLSILRLDKSVAELLANELITAANRLGIQEKIAAALLARQADGSKREQVVMRQVLRAQTVLRDFVAWLGYLEIAPEQRPNSKMGSKQKLFISTTRLDTDGLPELPEVAADLTEEYVGYWLTGLNDLVMGNAGHAAGSDITLEQNQALGRVIAGFPVVANT